VVSPRILEYGRAYARPYSNMRGLTTGIPEEPIAN
jgi:hypothetical protein